MDEFNQAKTPQNLFPADIILDTSSLLTLFLSGHDLPLPKPKQADPKQQEWPVEFGNANTLLMLLRTGQFRLHIPDMVLAEFFDVWAPVRREDIVPSLDAPSLTASDIPLGFTKRNDRIALIKELIDTGNCEIHHTPLGDTFLTQVRSVLGEQKIVRNLAVSVADQLKLHSGNGKSDSSYRDRAKQEVDELLDASGNERLRKKLLHPASAYTKCARRYTQRNDAGEIACADVALELMGADKESHPRIFVLGEGHDVRQRFNYRLLHPKDDQRNPAFDAMREVNPNSSQFNPALFAQFKDSQGRMPLCHLSTKGFLAGIVKLADVCQSFWLDRDRERPDGRLSTGSFNMLYSGIIDEVNKNGLPRVYAFWRDRALNEGKFADEGPANPSEVQKLQWINHVVVCAGQEGGKGTFSSGFASIHRQAIGTIVTNLQKLQIHTGEQLQKLNRYLNAVTGIPADVIRGFQHNATEMGRNVQSMVQRLEGLDRAAMTV